MCYVVGLSSLSKVKNFFSSSVSEGGKGLCFCCVFSPVQEKEILDFIAHGSIIQVFKVALTLALVANLLILGVEGPMVEARGQGPVIIGSITEPSGSVLIVLGENDVFQESTEGRGREGRKR